MVLSRDGPINGYVVVFDMQGVCLRHLTLVQFGALRNFMSYIQVSSTRRLSATFQLINSLSFHFKLPQEAHPVRLKKIYVIHTAWFINQAFAIVKPFIKTELMSLLHFTTGGADEIFPTEILPSVSESNYFPFHSLSAFNEARTVSSR